MSLQKDANNFSCVNLALILRLDFLFINSNIILVKIVVVFILLSFFLGLFAVYNSLKGFFNKINSLLS